MCLRLLGSFLLQDMLGSLHEFAFEGQNRNFKVLLAFYLYSVPHPQVQYVVSYHGYLFSNGFFFRDAVALLREYRHS